MTDDLTALRELAEKATPGPWHFHQDDGTALDISEVCIPRPEEDVDLSIASLLEDRDGAFIAATNPSVVLALLDRLESAEAAIERVRDIHRRVGASWPHEGGVYVCSADNGRWPCRTVAALDTGKEAGE